MAEEKLDDLPPEKKPKGTDAWGKRPKVRFDSTSVPLFRCKRCKVRVLERDLVGHLRRCVGYSVRREDVEKHYKQAGTYAFATPEFHPDHIPR